MRYHHKNINRNPIHEEEYHTPQDAVVVFVPDSNVWWLKILRGGFRHCFVALNQGDQWIVCDPLFHRTDIVLVSVPAEGDLAVWYRRAGLIVVQTIVRRPPTRLAPIRPYTCVEAVKRVLGIHEPWVLTPWQLYKFLNKGKNRIMSLA